MSVYGCNDEYFVPLLGTLNGRLEMIILHTRKTSEEVNFGNLTVKN